MRVWLGLVDNMTAWRREGTQYVTSHRSSSDPLVLFRTSDTALAYDAATRALRRGTEEADAQCGSILLKYFAGFVYQEDGKAARVFPVGLGIL